MRLTFFTDYCLRALMYLSQHPDKNCTAREIAENYNISLNHTVKVMHRLSQLGYIESTKGKGGGVKLKKKPKEINIWELVKALEPDFTIVECFSQGHNSCRLISVCGLKSILQEALKSFAETLAKYTIADAIRHPQFLDAVLSIESKKNNG